MSIRIKTGKGFYGDKNYQPPLMQAIAGADNTALPITGGRSSVPDVYGTAAPATQLIEIPPDFPVEFLATLENLCAYNPDISYALDNIVQLANTEHEIFFSDKITSAKAIKMKAFLKERSAGWYAYGGGERSLKADLLTQVATNGALSAEIIPTAKLDRIKQIVRVRVKNIRFFYNYDTDLFAPYQITNRLIKKTNVMGMVELNTNTYHYIALRRHFQTPYATPPFISAIDSLITQKDMMQSFKEMMKNLGLLGFLTAKVDPLVQLPGEDMTAYFNRSVAYLQNVVSPQLVKGMSKGIVAGFNGRGDSKGSEFKLEGNTMNVTGAKGLFDMIQARIFAAVKQDPNMNGVNQATTETFGRVILTKMLSQVEEYQGVVDSFIEQAYMMELKLAGMDPGYVKVKSKKPLVNDRYKDLQADNMEIINVKTKRDMGIIDQDTSAQELDYDEPAMPGDIVTPEPDPAPGKTADPVEAPGDAKAPGNEPKPASNAAIRSLVAKYGKNLPMYDYGLNVKCGPQITRENYLSYNDLSNEKLDKFAKKYFIALNKQYVKYCSVVAETLASRISKMKSDVTIDAIQKEAYLVMLTRWEENFSKPIKPTIKANVTSVYNHYRCDKSIFPKKGTSSHGRSFDMDVADAVLDLDDYRAIQYMEKSDRMYLGKFITDKDTKKSVYSYLQTQYLDGYMPIGENKGALNAFADNFKDELSLEAWKIRRVVDTTMNKVRNFGNINMLSQNEIDNFEVVEIMDELTCAYCETMDGKVFSVSVAKEKIDNETAGDPDDVGSVSPFLTSEKLADVKSMTAEQLQDEGYDTPPYHCNCRGRVIADI
jgi:hypothetical protein